MRIPTLHARRHQYRAGMACLAAILGLVGPALSAQGALFTLIDDNSSVDIDTGSQGGVYNWIVDGVDHLYQQWFWYRVGNTAESSIDTLPIGVQGTSDSNFDGDDETLFVQYLGGAFNIEITFGLDGGVPNSGGSDLEEQISIINLTNAPLAFTFFQYADFDLNGFGGSDVAVFLDANTVSQSNGSLTLSETVVTPAPTRREINYFSATRDALNDGVATNLSDTPAFNVPVGPGDVTWAFQWDVIIPAFGTFQIGKDKQIRLIPEPSTWVMLGTGLMLLGARARRWRRK